MKNRPISKKKAILISTLLVAIAIPATVLGTQKIQDIRNQAEEEETAIDFGTNFDSDNITKAFNGIKYEKTIKLIGYNAKNATMYLGCDEVKCGSLCNLELHNPPYGLTIAKDSRTLVWDNPKEVNGRSSWDITLTAVAPNLENKEVFDCAIQRYTLSLSDKSKNLPPKCSISPVQYSLNYIPQNYEQGFILEGSDIDGGIESARVQLSDEDGNVQEKDWPFSGASSIIINKDSFPSLKFDMNRLGKYTVKAFVTDTDGAEVECDQNRNLELTIVIPGDNGSPEFKTDPYTDSTPGMSIEVGESYRYQAEATDPNNDAMDYFVINDTGWINFTVTDNEPGYFKSLFTGTPSQNGAYTLVLSLNDGYHDHYSTQIWVVDVGKTTDTDNDGQPTPTPEEPDLDKYPQILNVKPIEKDEISDTKPLISANFVAADGSKIKEGSVSIEVDDTNVTEEAQIRGEKRETGSVTYIPPQPLHKGSHRITVKFDDESGLTAEKSWTFTIESEEDDIPVPIDEGGIEILGYIISSKMATVLLIGFALIAMAIAIPWIMYNLWKKTQVEEIEAKPTGYFTSSSYATMPPEPSDQPVPKVINMVPEETPENYSNFDVSPEEPVTRPQNEWVKENQIPPEPPKDLPMAPKELENKPQKAEEAKEIKVE